MMFAESLFVTAGLVDEDDLPMDSPHHHFAYPKSGSPGPGAIGEPTTVYTRAYKPDDLGLSSMLAQVQLHRHGDPTANHTAYGVASATGLGGEHHLHPNRWEGWDSASRSSSAFDARFGGVSGGPRTAPPYPIASAEHKSLAPAHSSGSSPQLPMNHPAPADAASQVMRHMTALHTLIAPMAQAVDEVEKLKKEVEMWKTDWHKLGENKKALEKSLKEAQEVHKEDLHRAVQAVKDSKPPGPPFSVVLIDGDGLIFLDTHLQAGYQGGLQAARKLLSSLGPMLAQASASQAASSADGDIAINPGDALSAQKEVGTALVNIFLNKAGLGQTLIGAKILSDWKVYNGFFEGLSAAHELISVIDVGPGKEAADAKIREHLRLYARSPQCEIIVLGASHDNGYANILSSLQTENRLSKLLLLKGYSDLAGQLRQYSSRVVTIPELFRTTKLPQSFSSIAAAAATPSASNTTVTAAGAKRANATATKAKAKTENIVAAPPPAAKAPPSSTDDDSTTLSSPSVSHVEVFEWKEVASKKVLGHGKAASKVETSKSSKPAAGGVPGVNGKKKGNNAGQKRLYTVRTLDPRPCHTYYLSDRGCRTGDNCDYGHHYDLNDDEIDDLHHLAKEMVCPYIRNNKCHFTEEECVYGHYCPRGPTCKFGDTCRFRALPNGHGELDGQ